MYAMYVMDVEYEGCGVYEVFVEYEVRKVERN